MGTRFSEWPGTERLKRLLRPILAVLLWPVQRLWLHLYMRRQPVPRLHIGCGGVRLPGWINADRIISYNAIYLDARRRLPFADGSLHYIYHEHFISCLTRDEAAAFLRDCHRVLISGGVLRISTLDLAFLSRLLDDPDAAEHAAYLEWACETMCRSPERSAALVVNNLFYGVGYRFIYDAASLSDLLRQVGFRQVTRAAVGVSEHAALHDVERHGAVIGDAQNRLESLVVEAVK